MKNYLIISLIFLSRGISQDKLNIIDFIQYGNSYIGEFNDGKRGGQGTFIYPSGYIYEGEWKDDKRNGQGTIIYLNGDKYVGGWKNDKKTGLGIYIFING